SKPLSEGLNNGCIAESDNSFLNDGKAPVRKLTDYPSLVSTKIAQSASDSPERNTGGSPKRLKFIGHLRRKGSTIGA
ncbi:hypothetical protein, partial [Trichococcus ilyis]|uniref:hypothetical protein n=1 Tax=Trichococcus ilyis TaxID=640938 RepID=UPI001A96D76E